jgi:outer membrane protein OmpA-like peptidoglycan-associated protein
MNRHLEMAPISASTRAVFFSVTLACFASMAHAQTSPAPAPPPAAAPVAPPAVAPAAPASASVGAQATVSAPAISGTTQVAAAAPAAPAPVEVAPAAAAAAPSEPESRHMEVSNTLDGSSGLLRMIGADSGGTGTLRFSLIGTYYSGTGFLCPLCQDQNGRVLPSNKDKLSQIGTRFQLSVTPVKFLEAFAAFRYQSTSDNQGEPRAIQLVGDMALGVKAFTPAGNDQIFSFGGAVDTLMLASAGGVGLDTASVAIRALGTADFTRRADKDARIPLRIHVNAGYVFDNSGVVANDIEKERAGVLGNRPRITRIERFAHDIDRVDYFRTGIGVEGAFDWVRPFVEWSVDVPINRQSHACGNTTNRTAGDGCLSSAGFSAIPSRFSIGARAYPWVTDWLKGFSVLAAFDIGTGATSTFIEEVAPERPWAFQFGLGYAFDTQVHETTVEKIVVQTAVAPPPEFRIEGTVARTEKGEPIPNAIVRYVGRPLTGMVTDEQGMFKTGPVDPGEYRFAISADGYRDGDCTAMVPPASGAPVAAGATAPGTPVPPLPADGTAPPSPAAAPAAPVAPAPAPVAPAPGAPGAPINSGPTVTHVACELEALPRTATITGVLRDALTTAYIGGATVTITDPLGRQLALKTDAEGTFRFGNVPAGKSSITADSDGYLRASTEIMLEPRKDVSTDLMLNKRPATPNVIVTPTELKLKKEVHFLQGSAEVLPDSMSLLEEAADVIRSHPEIGTIEIQGHTDDTGGPDFNLRLSTNRANAVRDVFIQSGVDAARLTSHGYGQEKPLVPNTSEKNRARNRRVQLVIVK